MTFLAWVDLETSGLNPRIDEVLEVALVVTGTDLVERTAISFVVDPDNRVWEERLDEKVKAMHTDNGLLRDVATVGILLASVEDALITTLKRVDPGPFLLCGLNVQRLERPFIDARLRRFGNMLDYRTVDILDVRRFIRDICGREELMPPFADADSKSHRAMDDIQDAISEARIYAEYFRLIPEFT